MIKIFTNYMQNLVARFQLTFGHPLEKKPTLPALERFTGRKGWGAIEEIVEQLFVLSNNEEEFNQTIKTIHSYVDKAAANQLTKEFILDEKEKLVHLADGLVDELFFLLGDFCETGIDAEPIIKIVAESNQSKLFTDERGNKYVKLNENGKVMKSPEFFPPEGRIAKEVERQLKK